MMNLFDKKAYEGRATPDVPRSQFTETLIRANGLKGKNFLQWVFEPGMLFNGQHKWWGDRGKRTTPHEGLDVFLYRDQSGAINRFDAGTGIPAIADGVVVKILDDFLGTSLFIKCSSPLDEGRRFFIFYGHTVPRHDMHVGQRVNRGDLIADIADKKSIVVPHLHLSLGWISRPVSYDSLDWNTIGERRTITLVDPVEFLDWKHERIESATTA